MRVRVTTHIDELRLYGGGVYAQVVEVVLDGSGHLAVLLGRLTLHVGRGYDPVARQLPHMQFVHTLD